MSLFTSFFFALMTSMLLVPLLRRHADTLGLVDAPDSRKVHEDVVPRSGGVAIVCGALVPILLWLQPDPLLAHLLAGGLVIVLFGVLDDRQSLDYRLKFFGQGAAALIAMQGGLLIDVWPFLGIDPVSPLLSYPVTFFFLIGVTNAINFSDGLDGLAGGISLVTLGAIAFIAAGAGSTSVPLMALAIMGGLCGFLRYNNYPAVIFMGDTGSQFLGFMTAGLSVVLTQELETALNPAIVFLLLGLPMLDTLSVMIWRARRGQSPFHPDRNHFHHRLLDMGFRHYEAVATIYVAQSLLVLAALWVRFQADAVVVGVYVLASALILIWFRWARVADWHLRRTPQPGVFVERRNVWLRGITWLHPVSSAAVEGGFALLLVLSALAPPADLGPVAGVFCLLVGAVLLITLWVRSRRRRQVRRFSLLFASLIAVFLLQSAGSEALVASWVLNTLTLLLVLALVVAIRVTRRSRFSTTPLDILILLFVVVTLWTGGASDSLVSGGPLFDTDAAVARLAVFFYATELLCAKGNRYINVLSPVAGITLIAIGARVLL